MDKKIYIDIDDVIRNTCKTIILFVESNYGDKIVSPLDQWNVEFSSGKTFWDYYTTHPEIVAKAPPVPGAIQGVTILKNMGLNVIFISVQPVENIRKLTQEWMRKYFKDVQDIYVDSKPDKIEYIDIQTRSENLVFNKMDVSILLDDYNYSEDDLKNKLVHHIKMQNIDGNGYIWNGDLMALIKEYYKIKKGE